MTSLERLHLDWGVPSAADLASTAPKNDARRCRSAARDIQVQKNEIEEGDTHLVRSKGVLGWQSAEATTSGGLT